MTEIQRLLALDAALCACEGIADKDIIAGVTLLKDVMQDKNIFANIEPFGRFLDKQLDAVKALHMNPVVFGCDDDSIELAIERDLR